MSQTRLHAPAHGKAAESVEEQGPGIVKANIAPLCCNLFLSIYLTISQPLSDLRLYAVVSSLPTSSLFLYLFLISLILPLHLCSLSCCIICLPVCLSFPLLFYALSLPALHYLIHALLSPEALISLIVVTREGLNARSPNLNASAPREDCLKKLIHGQLR